MATIKPRATSVGHDGTAYYCKRCGKSGFATEMAVRGHQSACRGYRAVVEEHITPTYRPVFNLPTQADDGVPPYVAALEQQIRTIGDDLGSLRTLVGNHAMHMQERVEVAGVQEKDTEFWRGMVVGGLLLMLAVGLLSAPDVNAVSGFTDGRRRR